MMLKQMASAVVLSCACATAMAQVAFDPVAALAPDVAGAIGVAVGDVTGDGLDDVLVLAGGTQPFYRNRVILYRQVAGRLAAGVGIDYHPVPTSVEATARGITLADLDNDGDLDIVVSCGDFVTSSLVVLRNAGGTFTATAFPSAGPLRAFAFGDVDADGDLDLVGPDTFGTIGLYLGNGAAGFSPVMIIPGFVSTGDVTLVDMDSDGRKDLVYRTSEQVLVKRNEGSAFASNSRTLLTLNVNAFSARLLVRDFDGDGRADILSTSGAFPISPILLYQQSAGGVFHRKLPIGSELGTPQTLVAGDLNGDGRDDVLMTSDYSQTSLSVRLALPGGGFRAASLSPTGASRGITLGDINNDGRQDVVLTTTSGAVSYLLGSTSQSGVDLAVFVGLNANAGVVRIENRGTGFASGTYSLELNIKPRLGRVVGGVLPAGCSAFNLPNGSLEGFCQLPSLAVGAVQEVAFPISVADAPGGTALTIRAEASGVVGELSRSNNIATKTVRITPSAN